MDGERATAYIGLGSNVGERRTQLEGAIETLDVLETVHVGAVSSFYETEARIVEDQPAFLNACIEVRTELAPAELMAKLQEIERAFGRVRDTDKGPRTLDLDLLLYDDVIMDNEELTVPHPGIPERGFVLVPLAEIAGEVEHPTEGATIAELAERCEDTGWLEKID